MTVSAEHRALMSEFEQLISEERNSNTTEIDLLPLRRFFASSIAKTDQWRTRSEK